MLLTNIKALLIILVLATGVFVVVRPIFLRFTAPEDFDRRRMVWYVLTIVAFLSPSFWLWVLVAIPLVAWAARKDATPVALYLLLLFVIPPAPIEIPVVGINRLFALNNQILLALVVLLPAVWTRVLGRGRGEPLRFGWVDALLIAYGLLQLALVFPYEAATNTMRRGFLFLVTTYLVYFAFSRLLQDRRKMADAMGALCLAAAVYAPIAAFESLRGWLVYGGVSEVWDQPTRFTYLYRGDVLRPQVATGHSITLGYVYMLAIGFWLYLRSTQIAKGANVRAFGLLLMGLLFAYSRGPWFAAAILALIFFALESRNARQLLKAVLVLIGIGAAVLATPFGTTIVETLPFVGTLNQEAVTQRQQLAEVSWRLIQLHPFLGDPFVMLQMEELRSGEGGIIDLVNAYAQVALFYGLVGLALFGGVYVVSTYRAYGALKRLQAAGDDDMVRLGASLIACMLASLALMATSGHVWLEWVSPALLVSYANLQYVRGRASSGLAFRGGALPAGAARAP